MKLRYKERLVQRLLSEDFLFLFQMFEFDEMLDVSQKKNQTSLENALKKIITRI